MRTTLTIEPATAERINRIVNTGGRSMKDVVNEALREGLKAMENAQRPARRRFTVEAHHFGIRPGLDPDKLGQYAEELEDETIAHALFEAPGDRRG
jgi:hypothetical protein